MNKRVSKTQSTLAALLSLASFACGGDSNDPPAQGGDDAGQDSETPREDAGEEDSGNPPAGNLFDQTDACPSDLGVAVIRINGELEGKSVDYEDEAVSSNIVSGALYTNDGVNAQNEPVSWIGFAWDASLQPGEIKALTGDYLTLPDEFTSGAGPYCVVGGEIGATPEQPTGGAQIRFRITSVKKRSSVEVSGTCEGAPIAVELKGCMYRTNDYLP